MEFQTAQNGYLVALPDATIGSIGQNFVVYNISPGNFSFIITDFVGNHLVTITQGKAYYIYS